jgi:rubredoxin
MYDYFVASLACPVCGAVSPPDSSTNMQTHLRDDADGRELGVGFELDPLEVRAEDIAGSDYLPIVPPPSDGTATLLDSWECPSCGASDLWAAIELRDGRIAAISAVELTRATLDRAHFIAEECSNRAARISGIPWSEFVPGKVDPIEVLRTHLPPGDVASTLSSTR